MTKRMGMMAKVTSTLPITAANGASDGLLYSERFSSSVSETKRGGV